MSRGPLGKGRLAAEILGVYCRVRLLLWRRGLEAAVLSLRASGSVRAGRAAANGAGLAEVPRLTGATVRTLSVLPTDSRCLMRSLVVLGMLARRGIDATLVIGVRPGTDFLAHAWLEREDRALLPDGGGEYARLLEL